MSKGTTIAITVVCVLAVVIVAGIALFGTGIISFNAGSGNQGAGTPVPTAVHTVAPTSAATSAPVVNPTAAQTSAGNELTPLQKEGINLLVGKWYGKQDIKKLFFTLPAEFNADCKADFTGRFWGVVNNVPTMEEPLTFDLPMTWEYQGSHQFVGITNDGKIMAFTCDGTKISTVVNPYQLGLTDNSLADMDINIVLNKQ